MPRLRCISCISALLMVGCSSSLPEIGQEQGSVLHKQSSATPEQATETALVAFNVARSPTVSFHVPEMMCPEGCAPKVKEALAAQPGVQDVKVDFETKTAVVAIDEQQFDAESAIAVLVDDYGFSRTTQLTSEQSAEPVEGGTLSAAGTGKQG